jgi:hypothetical protein
MRDIDLREIDLKKLRVSKRTRLLIVAASLVIVAAVSGWWYVTHPPKPWLVRWRLDRYLAKQAHTSDFKVEFPFPSKAEMSRRPVIATDEGARRGSRTGKDFETLREEYLTEKTAALALERDISRSEARLSARRPRLERLEKGSGSVPTNETTATSSLVDSNITALRAEVAKLEQTVARRPEVQAKDAALSPVVDDLWEFQRAFAAEMNESSSGTASGLAKARVQLVSNASEKLNTASSYEAMYRAVGQELFVARRLLEAENPEIRREGVTIGLAAARQALGFVMNGAVAARICEGYVLPNLDLATDRSPRSAFNEQNLLTQCADIFRRNEEPNNVVRVYELYLASAKNPQRADWARSQIAMAYEQAGDAKNALAAIREIKDTNGFRFLMRRIPRLEQDAKAQKGS